MSTKVYNKKLNDFSRKYLIKGNEHLIKSPFAVEYQKIVNLLCEQLLIHDGISFKVYGENIPLAILVDIFGVKGTEELLEEGAIEFVLWNPGVTYMVDDVPGVYPLQSMGKFTSSVHSDPEASIESGIKFLSNPLPRRARRSLTRKAIKKYTLPPERLSSNAADFGHTGYNNNLFEKFGLPKEKKLTELNVGERKILCNLATQCLELTLLSLYQYSTYNSFDLLALNRSEFTYLKNANAVENVIDTVFEIEKIPDFSKMISMGMLDIKSIPKFRKTRGSKQFRTWIDQISHHTDKSDIAKEYVDSVIKKTFFQKPRGKLVKAIAVTTLGVAGGAIGGTVAGPVGAISGTIAGGATDLAISLFDSYILDNLANGWTPRHYIDKQIRPLTQK